MKTKTIFKILILLLVLFPSSFSFADKKQAKTYFKEAQNLSKKGEQEKALQYYLKAFELSQNGFYAARVGQQYLIHFKNYKKAMQYYLKAVKLNFKRTWVQSQMIKSLNWLSEIELSKANFKKSLKYLAFANQLIESNPIFANKYSFIKEKYPLLKSYFSHSSQKPKYIHKITVIIINEIKYSDSNINIHHKISSEELKYCLLSTKTLKSYVEALSMGALSVQIKIKYWKKPVASLKISNKNKFILDTEKLSSKMNHFIGSEIRNTDSFLFYWPSGSKQTAHGGAGKNIFNKGRNTAWRGLMQIPSIRMPHNGPHLLLHEFFHVVENMAYIRPRHGFRKGIRNSFPSWKGSGELNYYAWQFREKIPAILSSSRFKKPGWQNMNFMKRYAIKKRH